MFYGQSLKLLNPQFWRKVKKIYVQLPAQGSKLLNTHLTPLLVVTVMYKLSTSLPFFHRCYTPLLFRYFSTVHIEMSSLKIHYLFFPASVLTQLPQILHLRSFQNPALIN